jgi:hypothetical protein
MTDNQNGKFRNRHVNFSPVSNSALQDERLSLKAKGLYALIQCYNGKPNFDLYKRTLIKLCKEGTKAFDAAWKELKDTGYLKIYRIPSGANDRFKYEYELLDESNESMPSLVNLNKKREIIPPKGQSSPPENKQDEKNQHTPQKGVYAKPIKAPDLGESKTVVSAFVQTDPKPINWHTPKKGVYANLDSDQADEQDSHPPHFAPYANGNICEAHTMPNGGNIRNTDPRNIDLRNTKSVSQSTDDRQTDKIRNGLKEQIEYDYFEDNFPNDISGIDAIIDCLTDMLCRPSTKINGVDQSRDALKAYIDQVDSCVIREFMEHMKGKKLNGIKNLAAYWRSCLINYLREQAAVIITA